MAVDTSAGAARSQAQYSGRFVLAYRWVALAVCGLSLFWGVLFTLQGNLALGFSEFILAGIALAGWALASSGRLATALLLTQLTFLVFVAVLSLVFDIPNANAPRVSHIFFLVLAVLGYLNFKRRHSRVQLAIVALSVLAFVAFAASNYSLPFAQPLPDAVRLYGSWVNAAMATAMLVACVHALQLELERPDRKGQELKAALWNRQFQLFYQPQVDREGRIIGAETLLRWKHPKRGYVSPGEFIPQAEEAGVMGLIGQWVLETACRTLADWSRDPQMAGLTLSVNVSASQFLDESFERSVMDVIALFDINPALLKLEITESVMVASLDLVAAKMQVLRGLGVGMALDDFGTGYSSLGYLRRLPLTQLKIDRSFVQDVTENERSAALARSIIHLGQDLELAVLAEGVETEAQFIFFRDGGCEEFQGFYFGRPMPLADFEQGLLRKAA